MEWNGCPDISKIFFLRMDNTDKIKIDIAGRGNVAEHLRQAFGLNEERADTAIVDPHTLDSLRTDADFIIICVSDNAIGDVAARIPADTELWWPIHRARQE